MSLILIAANKESHRFVRERRFELSAVAQLSNRPCGIRRSFNSIRPVRILTSVNEFEFGSMLENLFGRA